MSLWKRGKAYWCDVTVNGERYREPLGTADRAIARQRERERVAELLKNPSQKPRGPLVGMNVKDAIEAYAEERKTQVSPRMRAWWLENAKPLAAFYGAKRLRDLGPADLVGYQNARQRAPKTVNGELSVLRQVLKHAKMWHRFEADYRPLRNLKLPVGQALTEADQEHLFTVAKANPQWVNAYVAGILSFFCGLRACEIRGLMWCHVDLERRRLQVRRSKTPAGWRDPTLNQVCVDALALLERGSSTDSVLPIKSWRSAWESLRKAAGLPTVRFHDGRHTALTRLAEAGQPDWVIQAQMGHVSPAMMKIYSHVRRQALNTAAAALEPNWRHFPSGKGRSASAERHTSTSQTARNQKILEVNRRPRRRLTAGCSAVELPRNSEAEDASEE